MTRKTEVVEARSLTPAEENTARIVSSELASKVAAAAKSGAAGCLGKEIGRLVEIHGATSHIIARAWAAGCKVQDAAAGASGAVAERLRKEAGEDARQTEIPGVRHDGV